MNAPNPVPPPASGRDTRPYEPSMEEILASIRRIIADDQSLPSRARIEEPNAEEPRAEQHGAEQHAVEEAASSEPGATASEDPSHVAKAQEPSLVETAPEDADLPEPEMVQAANEPIEAPPRVEAAATPQSSVLAPSHVALETAMIDPAVAPPALSDRLEAIHHQAYGTPAGQQDAAHPGSGDYFDPPEEYDRPVALAAEAAPLFSATTNSSVASAFNVLAASRLADNSDELLGMAREMIRPLLRAWLDENLPTMVERLVRDEIERVARGGR